MKVPKLRFKEFSGEWEDKKLIELSENGFSNGAFNDPKKVGYGYRIINVKDMYVDGTINVHNLTRVGIDENEFSKNRVEYGDIFFTRSSLVKEGIAYSNVNLNYDDDLTFDGHLIRMRPIKEQCLPIFLYYNFTTANARKQFIIRGKTTTMTTIGQEDIASVVITLPKFTEQQKIASFLSTIDTKINQLTRKKQLLEEYKKGVIQKIFSQELRFKADDGSEYPEWEEKKFGEVFSFRTTNSFSRDNLNYEDGEIKNIHYGDIHTKFATLFNVTKELVPFVNSEIELKRIAEDNYCKEGDLIIADASEDYEDIGKCIEIVTLNGEKVLAGLHTILARPDLHNMFIGFNGYLMKSEKIRLQIKTIAQGSKVLSISSKRLAELTLIIPQIPEQIKIADFLSAIDTKIDFVAKQLDVAKNFKKGLLQQMFV